MDHSLSNVALLLVAGLAAGAVNAIAGGGSLLTFPALIATGLPSIAANVTNSVSVTPGYLSSVWGSREDLTNQRKRAMALVPLAILGGVGGCVLLLVTPADVFEFVAPFLVLAATAVLGLQPRLQKIVGHPAALSSKKQTATMATLTLLGAAYGGYFGAALGVVLVAVLALVLDEKLQRINALKNVLSATIGLVTVAVYAIFGPVSWVGVAIVAPATVAGGYLGARLARKLSAKALRATIVTFGTTIGLVLLFQAFQS
ncbi:sulfite exporter TauE/SafE family protein [Cryptosporangium phraense]|uniref:Probable membrane transporter protein n=1 Tax=Cryptosporangium phraense TaxID=2593070 RepID=A0A545AT65_9ACTN|nr:sulfite exporter TauE/SafE family protein [Cryptosporangium phraense]TQS44518.1 sulfite exporter TauE/SafE family protein [Cryptosporangium phraense]